MNQIRAHTPRSNNQCGDTTQKRNGCKCKYKARCFYSKGAVLILTWNLLVTVVVVSFTRLISKYTSELSSLNNFIYLIPAISIIVAALLSGWLADAKFGNYRVTKVSLILLFLGAVSNCVLVLVLETVLSKNSTVFEFIAFSILISLIGVGSTAYLVSSLQLGLDQMPDASASSITSFIAWFVCSFATAGWIASILYYVEKNCIEQTLLSTYYQLWSLFAALCLSIVLISDFLFSSKWLIIEPKSPQSLKTIYRVLKFAANHKAPVNRSALTYWEEDIPSRLDLGKSRYGGPFTTEQVEDVKIIFRLLIVSLALWVVSLSLTLPTKISEMGVVNSSFPGLTTCSTHILYSFTYSVWWCMLISIILYEFALYPLVRNKLPSTLKRIGIAFFVITATSFLCLILYMIDYIYTDQNVLQLTASILYGLLFGILTQVIVTSVLEFVCAQSPYNMRGLFAGYIALLCGATYLLGQVFLVVFSRHCTSSYCSLISLSIKTALSLIGFVLHCILARWYKRRVRDDIYSPHRVVEEVYDRYLTIPN